MVQPLMEIFAPTYKGNEQVATILNDAKVESYMENTIGMGGRYYRFHDKIPQKILEKIRKLEPLQVGIR